MPNLDEHWGHASGSDADADILLSLFLPCLFLYAVNWSLIIDVFVVGCFALLGIVVVFFLFLGAVVFVLVCCLPLLLLPLLLLLVLLKIDLNVCLTRSAAATAASVLEEVNKAGGPAHW